MPKTQATVKPQQKIRKEVTAPTVVKRGRGRPRKEVVENMKADITSASKIRMKGDKKAKRTVHVVLKASPTKKIKVSKKAPVTDHRKGPRINNTQLLIKDGDSKRIPLPVTRVIENITSILDRAEVQQFRGRRERPPLVISMLESQSLQEAKVLFELKLSMQRDGQLRRKRVD
jgi:2,3-bisphosphoglycerate-independent phosphoglycerate mutase